MEYDILRTDKADELIHGIVLYVAEQFGNDAALKKLDDLETAILSLKKIHTSEYRPGMPFCAAKGIWSSLQKKI